MILYELLHRKMVVADLMYLGSAAEAEAFAFKVQGVGWGGAGAQWCEARLPASWACSS